MTGTETRVRLSIMWVFVMLNMIFADVLSFMGPGVLKQIMEGRAEQIVLTPGLLLVFAAMTEVPIAMVLLSHVLPHRIARWTNIAAAVFTAVYVIGLGSASPHYVFIAGVETLGCVLIARTVWTWRAADDRAPATALAAE